jgi:hypothetical protein
LAWSTRVFPNPKKPRKLKAVPGHAHSIVAVARFGGGDRSYNRRRNSSAFEAALSDCGDDSVGSRRPGSD